VAETPKKHEPEGTEPFVSANGTEPPAREDAAPRRDPDDPNTWLDIPGYRLLGELSRGGQAVIFLAVQQSTGRKVAIKVLLEGPLGSSTERKRMEREVRVLAELDHSNIVSVIDRGETAQGWPYFVLEYVEGRILAEYMDEYRRQHSVNGVPTSVTEILKLFTRICDAIYAAHLRGVVHRDIKPANIVIDNYGEPHILDFGLAAGAAAWLAEGDPSVPTASTEFHGSLPWASPEQAVGEKSKIDIRSDVYSLGIILYEMLTGDFPYDVFSNIPDALNNIREAEPVPPSAVLDERLGRQAGARRRRELKPENPIPPALDAIVLKALAKKREDRYQSAGELSKDIARYLAGGEIDARRPQKRHRQRRWAATVLLLAAVGAVAGAYLLFRSPGKSPPAPAGAPPAPEARTMGYRVEGNEVVFRFVPDRYDLVRMGNGQLNSISAIPRIYRVTVAGEFNGWQMAHPDWTLKKSDDERFTLRKPLDAFAGRARWPFKFVVNESIWVSAPEQALNKEIVIEDPATYNLVLEHPGEPQPTSTKELETYRQRIEAAWPGQGANLVRDDRGQYHFTFVRWPRDRLIETLEPLEGIPLSALNLGDAPVRDLSVLQGLRTLTRVIWGEPTRKPFLSGVNRALKAADYPRAKEEIENVLHRLGDVPGFKAFGALMSDGIANLKSLHRQPATVPPRAKNYAGHHYAFIPLPITWEEAHAFCATHGAHLATITDELLQRWVTERFGSPSLGQTVWLGGTDEGSEGDWRWVTGEPWAYTNWAAGQPNNEADAEHALAFESEGWWVDADGRKDARPFLMEWNQ